MDRRVFLGSLGISLGAAVLAKPTQYASNSKKPIRFGIVADVHHGMIPDTVERLSVFIENAIESDVDFIIQLGDFCHFEKKSDPFLDVWRQFRKGRYHVLGNHDMDLNTKEEIMGLWQMPGKYYTFDEHGVRFIVLDANYLHQDGDFVDYNNANFYVDDKYRTYIDAEQVEWFSAELKSSQLPVIVLSHQSLWHYQSGIKNRLTIQTEMEKYARKIICCFNGHNHIDFHHHQNGIDYFSVNSMSYQWMGEEHKASRYPREMLKEYKWLDHLAPYSDPLYAFAKLDLSESLEIQGIRSRWVPPSPQEAGVPKQVYGNQITPNISDYTILI